VSIEGDAYFNQLTLAEGLEGLMSIVGRIDFPKLPESEKQKIPALQGRS